MIHTIHGIQDTLYMGYQLHMICDMCGGWRKREKRRGKGKGVWVCERIRQKLKGKGDMFRYAIQYSVVPLSCVKRDGDSAAKVYEWINNLPILDFDRFVGETT